MLVAPAERPVSRLTAPRAPQESGATIPGTRRRPGQTDTRARGSTDHRPPTRHPPPDTCYQGPTPFSSFRVPRGGISDRHQFPPRFRSRGFRRLGSGDRAHESTSVTRRLDRVHIHPIRRLRTRRGRLSSPPLARPADPRAWNEGRLGEANTKSGKFATFPFHGLCRLGKIDWASESHQELDRCLSKTITASKNFND